MGVLVGMGANNVSHKKINDKALKAKIDELEKENATLAKKAEDIQKENAELKAKIAELEKSPKQ